MPRKGWSDAPLEWVQIVRGRRPKSERWPLAPGHSQTRTRQSFQPRQAGIGDAKRGSTPRVPQFPATVVREQGQIRCFHQGVSVAGSSELSRGWRCGRGTCFGVGVGQGTETSRRNAVARQIEVTKDFIARAKKRMLVADEKILMAQVAALKDARSTTSANFPWQKHASNASRREVVPVRQIPTVPSVEPVWAAELQLLRGKVNESQNLNMELQGSCKRQAVGVTPWNRAGPRLREDFVPAYEDILRWMQDRQADMQEATMTGNAHEVARLCHVMETAATSWSVSTTSPSMVCNSVM